MAFDRYYRALASKSKSRVLPRTDEAVRDYQDALRRTVDGMLFSR